MGACIQESPKPITEPEIIALRITALASTTTMLSGATITGALPAATPTTTQLVCWGAGGKISEEHISSELLPKRLDFKLYLPPCYQEQPERRYPVLYLIHGKSFTHDQWDRIGADEMADHLIAAGETAPFIIVMPRDRVWVDPPEDLFGEAIIAELIPWIDENYRTRPEREYRAIGGLSRGAAWAVHLGLGHWELFGVVGAHSMALFWEDVRNIPHWLDEMQAEGTPRIFVDVGRRDFEEIRNSTDWFGDLLAELDIPHEWYFFTGTHNEEYWSRHMEQYIRFYALEW
ncbi:MAG: hypothetical protein IH859_04510 [Chloroflexi bacterium]|nr:hypothetical protein [Chloroflexota bacterium]